MNGQRNPSTIAASVVFCLVLAGLVLSGIAVELYAQEWAPSWQLPKRDRPANMVDEPITGLGEIPESRFFSPLICSACHTDIFKQWKGSTHAYAWADPLFQALYKKGRDAAKDDEQNAVMDSCVRCHTPVGFTSGKWECGQAPVPSEASRQSIFCDFCHSIKATTGIGNAPFILDPGDADKMDFGTKRGPFDDCPETNHKTEYSELHTRSEFCGTCHDVSHAGSRLAVEQTYTEWRLGPYNTGKPETTVHCQDCHMRQRPGVPATGSTERPDNPGFAATKIVGGLERPHIWTHYFVGGTSLVLGPSAPDPERQKMAEERLKNAATVEILTSSTVKPGEILRAKILVENVGAGHYIPTGLTEVRQAWLEVTVIDADGKKVYHSGYLDGEGHLDEDAVVYHTVFGDKDGKPTLNVWEADHIISDHRIPTKGQMVEKYAFLVPRDTKLPLQLKAVLHYRSAPQWLAVALLGDKAPTIPIVDMAEASATLNAQK
ncbi:MAG: multiheme c-type cytochrome [Candidatus Brocadiales bacterium]